MIDRRLRSARRPGVTASAGLRLGARRALLAVAAIAALAADSAPLAAAPAPEIVGVRAGFAGHYKIGRWTPVEVTVDAGGESMSGQLELTVPDCDGVPSRVSSGPERPLAAAVGDHARQELFVRFGQTSDRLAVVWKSEAGTIAERSFEQGSSELPKGMMPAQDLVVMVGPPIALAQRGPRSADGEKPTEVAELSDVDELPTRWYGYEGVDLIVLSTGQPDIYDALDGDRLEALDQWMRLGGRMLLCVGRGGDKMLAAGAPLARFAPGRFDRVLGLRQSTAIESFAESGDRLDLEVDQAGAFSLPTARLLDVRGRVVAYEGNTPGDLPLIVRAPYGLGEVVFVAFDLDQPPVSTWKSRHRLVDNLLARHKAAAQETGGDALGQVTRLGYSDLSGQLHNALDQFAGVEWVPFWVVAALVVVYIVCIGPGDYFFLKKIARRMELTWVTFPLIVIAFSASAYWLAYRLKGHELRLNQVDLVDLDVESGLVRGTSWSMVYSPKIDSFDLALAAEPPAVATSGRPEVLLSWMAAPAGGLAGAAPSGSLFTEPYDFAPGLTAIRGLPISIWSTRSLVGRWSAQAASPVRAALVDRGDRLLSGELELPQGLELLDAVLLYDRWAYPLHQWQPGRTIRVEKQLEPQTAETYLRHITVLDEKAVRAPYDRDSTDIERIMEALLFHELVGGEGYTGLTHRTQGYVDLSNHLRLGRAILAGRIAAPAAEILRDEAPLAPRSGQHLTFYRFVLPVAQGEAQ